MPNANDVLNIERGEIGYSRWNDPQTGTKYGRWYAAKTGESWYGDNGVAYCAMFQSWCFDRAGVSCAGLPGAYCPNIVNAIRREGKAVSARNAQPGDIVLFDWNGDGVSDHIGIVERNNGSYLQTIEGNTYNGVVARRTRAYSTVIICGRPNYGGAGNSQPSKSGALAVDGLWGSDTTRALQHHFGTPVDGVVSGQWTGRRSILRACTTGWQFTPYAGGSLLIAAMQRALGIPDDGVAGPQFVNALESHYGYAPDGYLGSPSNTVKRMQEALNAGRF